MDGFKKELEDMELRLRNGGLGGVPKYTAWEKKLQEGQDISVLVSTISGRIIEWNFGMGWDGGVMTSLILYYNHHLNYYHRPAIYPEFNQGSPKVLQISVQMLTLGFVLFSPIFSSVILFIFCYVFFFFKFIF